MTALPIIKGLTCISVGCVFRYLDWYEIPRDILIVVGIAYLLVG